MMTFLTLRMVCLQNRADIVRVDKIRHVLGHDVVVVFNDQSQVSMRFEGEDGSGEADRTIELLTPTTTP
jgi:hypothetical protein